jgi:hypothetical protein
MARLCRLPREIVAALALATFAAACGGRDPQTDAERLARGREIVERMSARLAGAKAFKVTTVETRQEAGRAGAIRKVTLTRETSVRRPDRLYSKATGDRHNETWYDGVGITLVLHEAKVFGQGRAPETLDKALDALHERYGISAPFSDYAFSSPAKALLTSATTGGWVKREDDEGVETDHLSFKDTGVQFDLWIPTKGDPLPRRASTTFDSDKRLKRVDTTFRGWDLAPTLPDDQFKPSVPADYEGVAILQRAAVLRSAAAEGGGQP